MTENRKLSCVQFDAALARLQEKYRIVGPRRFAGRGAYSDSDVSGYGEITCLDDLCLDEQTWFSPKEWLLPVRETLFRFTEHGTTVPPVNEKPLIIFLRPCDINGIRRLDTIFLHNGPNPDFYYARRRELTRFFLIECLEGFDSCWCVSMEANRTDDYSCAFRFAENGVSVAVKDSDFASVFAADSEIGPFLDFVKENKVKVTVPEIVEADLDAAFQHELWREYTSRCIACGRCNTSCITCSCFTMQDARYGSEGGLSERRRVWAGCHIDGFTDMAGGHSFRQKYGDRMRFKTMHKINDFKRRFGMHMCIGCGRCDNVCPEYISFSNCINRLERVVKEIKKDE